MNFANACHVANPLLDAAAVSLFLGGSDALKKLMNGHWCFVRLCVPW